MIDSHSHHQQQLLPDDYLDRLPDELLLAIFSRVRDAADLIRLLSLCRRYRSLVPLVPSVSLSFAAPKPPALSPRQGKGRPSSSFAKNPLGFLYDRVFRGFVRRLVRSKPRSRGCRCLDEEDIIEEVGGRLKLFGEARDVRVSLPCEVGAADSDGTFLKWRASYGSKIRSCVILGAGEVCRMGESLPAKAGSDGEEGPVVPLSDGELKLRVVWIISCLIAASYRHHMMKKVIESCPTIRKIVVGDERGQGKVVMGEEEVSEARKEGTGEGRDEEETERSEVPDLTMKLWHVPYLELPRCGRALKGATLVVMTPVADGERDGDEKLEVGMEEEEEDGDGGDGVFVEAVRELRKRNKLYLLEMNSF
ncbi:hypothetical protein MLD38_003420 [Melastoma candidum]|uniref:Uncharacterized protein n=1 Tax=Melastoma candidum TaxID=119954 RepID=A0ACB9S5N4_9MYRT|nr:hypothetical protein MLD38_003420 [Melastoma candidum]